MPVTSNRSITIGFNGAVEYEQVFDASTNSLGSGQIQLIDLSSGDNSIIVPADAIAVTIIPPSDNDIPIRLKGNSGDTGINLSLIDPCSLSLDSVTDFVLDTDDDITGVRLIYS